MALTLRAPIGFRLLWINIFPYNFPSQSLIRLFVMDALIAKADGLGPPGKKRKFTHRNSSSTTTTTTPRQGSGKSNENGVDDATYQSISQHTSLPRSLRPKSNPTSTSQNPSSSSAAEDSKFKHIANKRLRNELTRTSTHINESKALLEDAQNMLLTEDSGRMEVEGELERTWRVGQEEISSSAGQEAARGRKEWKLDGGPYRSRYTRNGRHIVIAGKNGHVASFDWQTGQLHCELQLQETCRDITFV